VAYGQGSGGAVPGGGQRPASARPWRQLLLNAKYRTHIEVGFLDPSVNATFGVRPLRVFGMRDADFTGSPTRWIFED